MSYIISEARLNGIGILIFLKKVTVESGMENIQILMEKGHINIPFLNRSSIWAKYKKSNMERNSALPEPVNIKDNPNGYAISGKIGIISLVGYCYFTGIVETVDGFKCILVMEGLSYIPISRGTHLEVTFPSKVYYPPVYGVAINAATITRSSVLIVFSYIQEKRKRRKFL